MQQSPPGTPVLWALMAINFGVYALWHTWGIAHTDVMAANFLVSPESVGSGAVWTLLTSAFSHTDPTHLMFNLFALWIFGQPVYHVLGGRSFAMLYVVGGICGSLGHVLFGVLTGSPAAALGASGAVMAVAVPYGLWFPKRRLLLFFMIPMPAWAAVLLFIASDAFGLIGSSPLHLGASNIAHAAHLGGAVVGLAVALARLWRNRT